ncbi:MAG TPA: 5-oxoprolinase subunit PxpA [Vicinamibacterales bacterium]|nr:5-oxoprolinase subunit PxpA [Vicinamibacterales bacterium]
MAIDLNADVGESIGDDAGLLPFVSSANVACGFHAGNPAVMRSTVQLARHHGVAVGAHPGFQDLEGFGRRDVQLSAAELENLVAYQIGALAGVAATEGVRLSHVKPHGALYNMAARDAVMAEAIARAVRAVDPSLVLFGLSGSQLTAAGERAGLRVASEVFADRGYWPDGSLAPRGTPGAVMTEVPEVVRRAVGMARGHTVTCVDGSIFSVRADTICIHGDTPGAATLARAVREALRQAAIDVRAPRLEAV